MRRKHTKTLPKTLFSAVLVFALLLGVQAVTAAVTAEEAAQLKTSLTPFGAERAGNADGTKTVPIAPTPLPMKNPFSL
jgi:hypothetical protein